MKQSISITRALTWRYAIALALVASLSTAAWFSLHLVITAQESTALVVNISGRQRMLSQRTALFSNLLISATKNERPAIRIKLNDAIELMTYSHHGLIHGNKKLGLPVAISPAVHALYFDGPTPLDNQITTYIRAVNELLRQEEKTLTPDNPLLQYITLTASTSLLKSLDSVVNQYQQEGETSVRNMEKAETAFWLLTLLLLILEAALIFNPFIRHIRIVIGKLQQVTDELISHQDHLEETITHRTAELEAKSIDLTESEERFRLISTTAQDAIAIVGPDEHVTYWNPAAEKMFGYKADDIIDKNLHELLTPSCQRDAAHSGFQRFSHTGKGDLVGTTFETTALRKNGAEFPVELSISAFSLKGDWHALGIIRDITERKNFEMELKRQAHTDHLTGVNNRRHFMEQSELELSRSRRYNSPLSIFMLDVDFFKKVNDTYGHKTGDEVLVKLAEVCKQTLREVDIIGRIGGEEFAVLLPETDKYKAIEVAERLRNAIAQTKIPQPNGLPVQFTVSIGVASLTSEDINMDVLLNLADKALYNAKETGRNKVSMAMT